MDKAYCIIKEKKCKNPACCKKFKPARPLQQVCSTLCAIAVSKIQQAKKEKKEHQQVRKSLLTPNDYKKILEGHVNAIVRMIDFGLPCISCGHLKTAFAGHYHAVGSNGTLRYNLHNIHVQDFHCNGAGGGKIVEYGQGLIKRYGKKYKEMIEYDLVRNNPHISFNIEQLKVLIAKAREILKRLPKGKEYTATERVELRESINKEIGIYQ